MQKARRQAEALRLLVSMRFQVLFHSPHRGSFHLSLTVLVHYRSLREYLALPDGPGKFMQDSSCPALLGCQTGGSKIFGYATITLYGVLFHTFPLIFPSVMSGPTTPTEQAQRFRLVRVSLAATHGITVVFSSFRY